MAQEKKEKSSAAHRVLSVVGIVLCVIFALMLVCNLAIIIKGTIYPDEPASVLGVTPMVVLSGSMSGDAPDHIEVGDLIFVTKVEPSDLQVGDVIAFKENSSIVTHRIVGISTGEGGSLEFTTRGDANNTEDQNPVPADKVVGLYKARIPKVGDFALFLQTPLGMVIFIGVPVLAFILYDAIRRQRYAKREKRESEALEAELARLRAQSAAAEGTAPAPEADEPDSQTTD